MVSFDATGGPRTEGEKAAAMRGRAVDSSPSMQAAPDACWADLFDFETAGRTTEERELRRLGLEFPPGDGLPRMQVTALLEQLIDALARRRVFLHHTDHLGDRALYAFLRERVLTAEKQAIPPAAGGAWVVDLLGAWSEEDLAIWLRYYADDDEREEARDAGRRVPRRERLPRRRDAQLPAFAPPEGAPMMVSMPRDPAGAMAGAYLRVLRPEATPEGAALPHGAA